MPLSLPSSVLQPISLHYCFSLADHKQRLSLPPVCLCVRPSIRPPARPPTANRSRKSLTLRCRSNTQETERFFLGFKEERDVERQRDRHLEMNKRFIHFRCFAFIRLFPKTKEISITHTFRVRSKF